MSQVIYHGLRTLFLLRILCSLFFKYLFDIEIFQRFLAETPIFYMYCDCTDNKFFSGSMLIKCSEIKMRKLLTLSEEIKMVSKEGERRL